MSFTIEELQNDLTMLNGRKEQSIQQFHQLTGAISVLEQQINKLSNDESEKVKADEIQETHVITENQIPDHSPSCTN